MKRLTATIMSTAALALVALGPCRTLVRRRCPQGAAERPRGRHVFSSHATLSHVLKNGQLHGRGNQGRLCQAAQGQAVEFHYIDFQNRKNAAYAKAYKVTGPALIVAKVANKKVTEFKNLKDIWTNVKDKKAFMKYVQDHVKAYRGKEAAK